MGIYVAGWSAMSARFGEASSACAAQSHFSNGSAFLRLILDTIFVVSIFVILLGGTGVLASIIILIQLVLVGVIAHGNAVSGRALYIR